MGEKVKKFEKKFAKAVGSEYAVYVNSGSSANLLMLNVLKEFNQIKNKVIVIPALCWSTTISPAIQLGYKIKVCDVELVA